MKLINNCLHGGGRIQFHSIQFADLVRFLFYNGIGGPCLFKLEVHPDKVKVMKKYTFFMQSNAILSIFTDFMIGPREFSHLRSLLSRHAWYNLRSKEVCSSLETECCARNSKLKCCEIK